MINEGIASNARLVVIGFRETAIDDHQSTASLDGVLAFGGMNGNVSIDDMTVQAFYLESIEDAITDLCRVA